MNGSRAGVRLVPARRPPSSPKKSCSGWTAACSARASSTRPRRRSRRSTSTSTRGLAARSPGVFNVLWLLEECRRRALPWLYLGYQVAGAPSMEYKSSFRPHETLGEALAPGGLESAAMIRLTPAEPARPHDLPDALALLARAGLPPEAAPSLGPLLRRPRGRRPRRGRRRVSRCTAPTACCAAWRSTPTTAARASPPAGRGGDGARARRARCAGSTCSRRPRTTTSPRHGFAVCSRDEAPAAVRGSWEFRSGCPATAVLMLRPVG